MKKLSWKLWLRTHGFWLALVISWSLVVLAPLGHSWIEVWRHSGRGLAPFTNVDDIIYNQIMSSGAWCLQNHSSTLPEGMCRVRPLWWVGGKLDFGYIGLGALWLRILLLGALFGTIHIWTRVWARINSRDANQARLTMTVLLLASPLPLAFMLPYLISLPELTLAVSVTGSVPNLFSWVLYLVSVGGLYLTLEKPAWWPAWGFLAGIWALNHPYYLVFCLSVYIAWLLLKPLKAADAPYAIGLVTPMLAVTGYYVLLARHNAFFAFHLTSNVTHPSPGLVGMLVLSAIIMTCAGYWLWRATQQPAIDRFLLSWLTLAITWQFVPTQIQRRMALMLTLPVAILALELWQQLPRKRRLWHIGVACFIVINTFLTLKSVFVFQDIAYSPKLPRHIVSRSDVVFEQQLSRPGAIYIGTDLAVKRLFPVGDITIINAHHHESPAYYRWDSLLHGLPRHTQTCNDLARSLRDGHIAGIITSRDDSLQDSFRHCHLHITQSNHDWTVWR